MSLDKNYQGTDADLETSLEEYGFVARPIKVDYEDEYFVIYKMGDNQYGSGHIRESELDAIVNGSEWASEEDVASMLDTIGATKEEWFKLSFTHKFSDLVSYWGTENIIGTDYYPNDKKWAFEEIGLESDSNDFEIGGRVDNCIEYIKNSESIKNNGYYLHIDNMNNYVGSNTVNIPKIDSLCLITFNSGGQKNLKAVDTINSILLASEIAKLLNIDIEMARIIVYEQTTYSKPFTMDMLDGIKNKNIIVADRDTIVCTNLSMQFADGGEAKKLGVVKVIFENPEYNYTTNVAVNVTEEEARKYFVGEMVDVGVYPKENMQKIIDIEFSKSKDNYADGGDVNYAGGGSVKGIKKKAEKLLEERISYRWKNTDMGSGWLFQLESPLDRSVFNLLEEELYLDEFSPDDMGIEDYDNLSKEEQDYYYEDWKEELLQSTFENFKEKCMKHLDDFIEYIQQAKEYQDGGGVGEKVYNEQFGVGKSKYVVNFYDGVKTHKDGSAFFDIRIFKNIPDKNKFINELKSKGYIMKYDKGGEAGKRVQDNYDTLIGRIGNEFYFLDYIFTHSDDFKGATGTTIMPVNKEYYEYATSEDGILERYVDAMGEDEWISTLGLDRDDFEDEDELTKEIENGIYNLYTNGELNPFDEADYRLEEQLRELPEFSSTEEYPIFEVIGGGRIFNKELEFDEIYNQELFDKIRKIEEFARGGSVSSSELNDLMQKINESSGAEFYLGGAYGNYELWAKDSNGGDNRIEVGSRKDIKEALIQNRYNKKYTKYAGGGRVKVGVFDDNQLRNKEDKKAVEKAQKETGLNYVDTKIKKKGGKMFLEVYLISDEEYYNSSKFAKGGGIKSDYYIFEGFDHFNSIPLYQVNSSSENDNEYVGEWHTDKSDAEKELESLNENYAKGGGVGYYNGMTKEDIISKSVVYDNPETFDRYTVFTPDGSVFGMSENASGFNQYVGEDSEIQKGKHLGRKLKSVPTGIEWAILDRMKEEYADGGGVGKLKLLSDKFTEVGYNSYARNFGVVQVDGKNINILVSAVIHESDNEEFEDKPYEWYIELFAYPQFWSDEYAENIKDMVGDDTINPRSLEYLYDAQSYGYGLPLSTYADDVRFSTTQDAIDFLNNEDKGVNEDISGLGMLSGFHFDKQYNRIGDTGWSLLYKQIGANEEEYARGGGIKSDYYIFEGFDHFNSIPLYQVNSSSENDNEYVGEWHTDKSDAEKELESLNENYAKGGGVGNLSYEKIYEVLKENIDESIDDLGRTYENSSHLTGEEVEHKFRDGFIPYTNGGYELSWYEYVSTLNSTGYTLPTEKLQAEMQRHVDYSYELAKDNFKDTYPEIVEVIGEDNIDYNSLDEAGFTDEAQELSDWEMEYLSDEDTIRCSIIAYYYEPTNEKGQDGKHTISLQGDINLEAPYHRKGKNDDFTEVIFTFDSMEELKSKLEDGLKNVIDWFNGSKPTGSDDTFAKGGGVKKRSLMSVAHLVDWKGEGIKKWYIRSFPTDDLGEEMNDTNTFEDLWNSIQNKENVYDIIGVGDSVIRERLFEYLSLIYDVDYSSVYDKWLESADDSFAKGGKAKPKAPKIVRTQFEEGEYEYAKGGGVDNMSDSEVEAEFENLVKMEIVASDIDEDNYEEALNSSISEKRAYLIKNEREYAKGGGVRKSLFGNREYSYRRNWTNEHRHHNKSENYEVPMSKRKRKYAEGGKINDWKNAKIGDSARVLSENKMGLIIKDYGRKFHLKFVNGSEKTYDASELEFYKFEEEFAKGGEIQVGNKFGDWSITQYKPIVYEEKGGTRDGLIKLVNQDTFDEILVQYDGALRNPKWFARSKGVSIEGKSPKEVIEKLKIADVDEYAKGGGVGIDSTFESENDSLNTFKGYNDYFIIEFNGKIIHSVKTKSQHLKKLNELVDKYNLTEIKQKNSEFSNGGGVRISVLNELYNLKDKGVTQVQLNGFSENIGYVIGLRLDDTEIEKVGNNAYITLYKNGGGVGYYKGIKKEDIISKTIVYDNPETFDRYTVFTPDGSVFGMSENASGFNQYVGEDSEIQKGKHLGRKLKSVPTGIEWAILDRMKEEYAKGGGVKGMKLPKDAKIRINYVDVSVYKDSYKEGETDNVNNYDMNNIKGSIVTPKELVNFLAKNIYTSDNPADYVILDNNIHTSQLQDADGSKASESEIERWKKGDLELYSANFVISVSIISEIDFDEEVLSSLTGIGVYKKGGKVKSKTPKMVRTQFEEGEYEYAKGGGVDGSDNYKNVFNHLKKIKVYGKQGNSKSISDYLSVYSSPKNVVFFGSDNGSYSCEVDVLLKSNSKKELIENSVFQGLLDDEFYTDDNDDFAKGGEIEKMSDSEVEAEFENLVKMEIVASDIDEDNYEEALNSSISEKRAYLIKNEREYAKGGGVRTSLFSNREYSYERNWTNEHRHQNKSENYEVPMSKRKRKYAEGGKINDWKNAKIGDSARVLSENKMGLIIKDYGRKFHLKFVNGSEKTYDASELEFYKFEEEFAKGGGVYSDMTEKEFLAKYFGANVYAGNPSEYFDIKKISSSNDSKVENFISELKRDGYSVKKKSYSDFTSVMGVKKKGSFADGGGVDGVLKFTYNKEDFEIKYPNGDEWSNNGMVNFETGVTGGTWMALRITKYFPPARKNNFSVSINNASELSKSELTKLVSEKIKGLNEEFNDYKRGYSYSNGGGVDDADWIEESLIDLQNEVDMDDLVVENSNNNHYTASNGDAEFEVFETEDDARERAIERVKEDLEENPEYFSKDWLMNYIDGEDFFTEVYNEWNESYANDIESEDSDKYANRLIEEMVENGIVSSEEAKEDGFDAEDYKDAFVELMTSNQMWEDNGLEHYIDNFGEEQAFKVVSDNNLIDIDKASESAVDTDGVAHFLSSYDGEQIDLSNGHVAYRTN